MQTHHLNEIRVRLDRLRDDGVVEIKNAELRRWYSRERITKPVWRDLNEKWHELEPGVPIFIGALEGSHVLIYGEGLSAKPDAWFQPLTKWAQISEPFSLET